jgi:TM2 domain-containing membrane protein YozV
MFIMPDKHFFGIFLATHHKNCYLCILGIKIINKRIFLMDRQQADMLMMNIMNKVPAEQVNVVRNKLYGAMDVNSVNYVISQLKDPTTMLIISIFLGGWGVDRFMLGDTGLGIGKLLTGGGCGIWAIIDWFMIQDATKQKNFMKIMQEIR